MGLESPRTNATVSGTTVANEITVEDLTVTGTTTTLSTTNTVISDKLIELANGTSGTPSGDAGIIIERGSSNNAAFVWDESIDSFVVGTTTATGASTGDLSVTDGALKAGSLDISGDVDVDGTLETDALTVNGTAIADLIAATTSTNATNSAHVLVTDNESTAEENLITFVENGTSSTGNVGLEMDGNLTYNPSTGTLTATSLAGTLTTAAQTAITSVGSLSSLSVDNNVTDTNAGTFTALTVDFDKTGASSSNNTMIGLNLDMDNTTATGGTNTMTGALITPTLTHANASGTTLVKGLEVTATGSGPGNTTTRALDLTATGADFNQGVFMKIDDGGPDIKMLSSADNADFSTISTSANGALTIATTDGNGVAGHVVIDADGDITLDADGGTITFADAGSSLGTITSSGYSGTAAIATTVTVADESSDTSCNVLFTTAATGDLAPKSGTNLTFNSSNGTLACTALSISGDADIDGTLEADAITVNGVTLAETIADTVGAMVGSNTETGITVSYDDADNTLDFVLAAVGTNAISDDAVTLDKMAGLARGKIIVGDSSGNPVALALGNDTQVLTSNGSDVIWANASGGGSVSNDDANLILAVQSFS